MNYKKADPSERIEPEAWRLIEFEGCYKIFSAWRGGYLDGDSWRISSAVVSREDLEDRTVFSTKSGSTYTCWDDRYGDGSFYTTHVMNEMVENAKKAGLSAKVLDFNMVVGVINE